LLSTDQASGIGIGGRDGEAMFLSWPPIRIEYWTPRRKSQNPASPAGIQVLDVSAHEDLTMPIFETTQGCCQRDAYLASLQLLRGNIAPVNELHIPNKCDLRHCRETSVSVSWFEEFIVAITLDKTVREIASETPSSIGVFETLGIDYCCGGGRSLEQACAGLHLDGGTVLEKLEKAAAETNVSDAPDWQAGSLAELTRYIVGKHHKYVRQELVRLEPLGNKVCGKHSHVHPELKRIMELLLALRDELSMHMTKEEQVLFPHIMRLEHAAQSGQPGPKPPFGSVANPIRVMIDEHDDAGSLLGLIRKLSNEYQPPADACPSFQAFYSGVREFERDLHQHIHLENNILFPRALLLEQESVASR